MSMDIVDQLNGDRPCSDLVLLRRNAAGEICALRKQRDELRALLSAYVRDETRFNRGEGEPYGSITTETGMRARAATAQ